MKFILNQKAFIVLACGIALCTHAPLQAQTITTGAGDGTATLGASGTGATNSIAVDAGGNKYVATGARNVIRKITPGNVVTTFAGTGAAGFSGDNGAASAATFNNVQDLFITNGNLYVADGGNRRIRKIDLTTNIITTVAGNGTTAITGGGIGAATGVAADGFGNVYVATGGRNVVMKVTPGGVHTIFAGTGTAGFSGDNGTATAATLNLPTDLYIASGNLYIADTRNRRIRLVNLSSNVIITVAGDGTANITGNGIGAAVSVVVDGSNNIFVATGSAGNAVRKVAGNVYTTVAGGNASGSFSGDNGSGTGASLNLPVDLAMSGTNLLIADEKNRRVRNLTLTTVPLSIDLLRFTAVERGPVALLQWSAIEKDVDGYDIERSGDSRQFSKTGSVKSSGDQPSAQANYTFTDRLPLNGTSFYRLNMINKNGSRSYSPVVSVTFADAGETVISPVPSKDRINLHTPSGLAGSTATLVDVQGKVLTAFTLTGNQQVELAQFASGIYYLKLANGTTLKVVKE